MLKEGSELDVIENSEVALHNATENKDIAELLDDVGIGGEQINEGKTYLKNARDAYFTNHKEDKEALISHDKFEVKLLALTGLYRGHRRKAKVLFRDDYELTLKLDLTTAIPKSYLNLMHTMELFYTELNSNEAAKTELLTLKVTEEEVNTAPALITEVKTLRKAYLDEKGESQSATKKKDAALNQLDKWMRDFFAIAKIALEDDPQLLESLGKKVKS